MPARVGPDGRAHIDAALVRRLVAAQFPQWSGLEVTPVEFDGWDNRTYRLGTDKTVRLPTAESYAPAIEKEHRWLPVLAPRLPVEIPVCLASGEPGEGYPYKWSIRRWIAGTSADRAQLTDEVEFAKQVAQFLRALQRIDPAGGPAAGAHSFYRGAPPAHYDGQTRHALQVLAGQLDTAAAAAVWDEALGATWTRPPVWFHGDVASGNLLTRNGRLSAVIDFGTCGVGDPACDLVIAWTSFSGPSRAAFRTAVEADHDSWARARGWALWKALIGLAADLNTESQRATLNRRVLADVLSDFDGAT